MGKVTTSISIDTALHDLAKQKGIVLSHFVEQQLKLYMDIDEAEIERLNTLERLREEKAKKTAELSILKEKERQIIEETNKKPIEKVRLL